MPGGIMGSLEAVFSAINQLRDSGAIESYAIGGATAVLFYAEPTRTYDLDVFVILPASKREPLSPLAGIYEWARREQYILDAEHILINGVPVQFLPAYTNLVEESVRRARVFEYEGVQVILESGAADAAVLRDVLTRHGLATEILDGA